MPTNEKYNNESKELDTAIVSEKTPFWCPDHQKWEKEVHRPNVTGTDQKDYKMDVKKSTVQEFGRIMLSKDANVFQQVMDKFRNRDTGGVINSPGSGDYNTGQWHSPEVPNVEGNYPYNIEPGADHSHGIGRVNRNESPEHSHGVGPFRARGEAPFKSDRFHRHGGNPIRGLIEGFKGGRDKPGNWAGYGATSPEGLDRALPGGGRAMRGGEGGGYWGTQKPRWRLTASGRAIPRDESSKPNYRMGERIGAQASDELSDWGAEVARAGKQIGGDVRDMWGEDVKRGARAAGRGVDAALHAVEDTKAAAGRGARKVGRGAGATARAYARSNDPMMFSLQRMFLKNTNGEEWDPDTQNPPIPRMAYMRQQEGRGGKWGPDMGPEDMTPEEMRANAQAMVDTIRYSDQQTKPQYRALRNSIEKGGIADRLKGMFGRKKDNQKVPDTDGKPWDAKYWETRGGADSPVSSDTQFFGGGENTKHVFDSGYRPPSTRPERNRGVGRVEDTTKSVEKNTNLPMPSNEDTGGTDEIGRASASRKPKGFYDPIFGNEPDKQELIDSLTTGKEHEVKVPTNIQNMARMFFKQDPQWFERWKAAHPNWKEGDRIPHNAWDFEKPNYRPDYGRPTGHPDEYGPQYREAARRGHRVGWDRSTGTYNANPRVTREDRDMRGDGNFSIGPQYGSEGGGGTSGFGSLYPEIDWDDEAKEWFIKPDQSRTPPEGKLGPSAGIGTDIHYHLDPNPAQNPRLYPPFEEGTYNKPKPIELPGTEGWGNRGKGVGRIEDTRKAIQNMARIFNI